MNEAFNLKLSVRFQAALVTMPLYSDVFLNLLRCSITSNAPTRYVASVFVD